MRSPCSAVANGHGCGCCRAAALVELLANDAQAKALGAALLTNRGVEHVRLLAAVARAGSVAPLPIPTVATVVLPRWDADGRQLWLGDRLLKSYRQPAHRQVVVLAAFEEQHWEPHIDDPLPPEPGDRNGDAADRLHAVIQNLNRALPAGTIRFLGDGTGEGVRWIAYRRPAGSNGRPRRRPQ